MSAARITVTSDPDVAALIRKLMRERGVSFKEAINSAVRAGLGRPAARRRRFVQSTYSMSAEQTFRWDKARAVAEAMEEEELSRKLSLRK